MLLTLLLPAKMYVLVLVGILMNMMILFEIPVIAVLYVWCQLNKGMDKSVKHEILNFSS